MSVVDYCTYIKYEEAFADEIAIYLLSIVTGLHCAVMYRDGAWFTCQNKSEKHCDIVLAYTGGTTFVEVVQSHSTKEDSGNNGYKARGPSVPDTDSTDDTVIYDPSLYVNKNLLMRCITRSTVQALLSLGEETRYLPLDKSPECKPCL